MPDLNEPINSLSSTQAYRIVSSLVVPRPIAWVSTLDSSGIRNLAPHSFFNMASATPPIVHFSSNGWREDGEPKDSLRNARDTGEFVVNIVDSTHLLAMNISSADFPAGEDEFLWADLESEPSLLLKTPRVRGAMAALGCRVETIVEIGDGHVVFGQVVEVHISERVWQEGRVNPKVLDPIARLGGSSYARLGEVFHLQRPTWADLQVLPESLI